jgi:hypothetical protein
MIDSAKQIVTQAQALSDTVAAIVSEAANLVRMEAEAQERGGGGLREAQECGKQAERYEYACGVLEELGFACRDLRADLQGKAQGWRLEQSDYLRAFADRAQ